MIGRDRRQILHAYRALLRAGLRAVQHATPGRYIVRSTLSEAFRDRKAIFSYKTCMRTLDFLNSAAKRTGLEHKIVKNLVHVKWWQREQRFDFVRGRGKGLVPWDSEVRQEGIKMFENTLRMLNESMGMCLK